MVAITLPDGSVRTYEQPITGAQLAADIGPGLAKAALALRIGGEMKDLNLLLDRDQAVSIVTRKDADALELLRHDAAHVMAEAVQELYPNTQVTIGPSIENGFYYDFSRNEPFSPEDFGAIEAKMREIIGADKPLRREVWSRADLIKKRRHLTDAELTGIVVNRLPPPWLLLPLQSRPRPM